MERTPNRLYVFLIYAALALTTIIVFEPVRHSKFLNYDDDGYVTKNLQVKAGITPKSVVWAFTTPHGGISYWHPLTWLSHMLDCELFGLNPAGHHLTNLLLHTINVLLLFWVLRRMTGGLWQSAFVAAVFALHPLNVESVAWIAERKNLLSTFFWLLTMAAYMRYVNRPAVGSYLLTLFVFALGLMAKPILVTLPFVLLLLDYWPLGRFQWKTLPRLIWEKIPFFTLSALLSIVTFLTQRSIGTVATIEKLSLNLRIENALVSYIGYIVKMIHPSRLAILYPHPADGLPPWQPLICLLILIVISAAVIYFGRSRRYLAVGWLWYMGVLVPVIGLVQVGSQAMADRYTYLPLIGMFIIVAWGAADLSIRWRHRTVVLGLTSGLVFTILLLCTRAQVRYWRDNFTLYEHTIEVTVSNPIMHNNLGQALQSAGRLDEALSEYYQALRIAPDFALAHKSLGIFFHQQGELKKVIYHWSKALKLKPEWVGVMNNLAWLEATGTDPALRAPAEAVKLALRACEITGYNDPEFLDTLAAAYAADGKFSQALETAEKALKLAEAADQETLAGEIRWRLRLYKAGKPYRGEMMEFSGDTTNAK